jgi:hypothetical protein
MKVFLVGAKARVVVEASAVFDLHAACVGGEEVAGIEVASVDAQT